jgi:tellurite resistance protein
LTLTLGGPVVRSAKLALPKAFEAELHRARGEMLLRRNPAAFATAEQALQAAVAIARQQGTLPISERSFLAAFCSARVSLRTETGFFT